MIYLINKKTGHVNNMGTFDKVYRKKMSYYGRYQWCWLIIRNGIPLAYPCTEYEFYMITKI